MIQDRCPQCPKVYKWDPEQDVYCGATVLETEAHGRLIQLHTCTCGGTIGVSVLDEFGEAVYIPSTKEL